ncbi:MAG: efflux RND transporter permease subunit [Myxococcota bacterium]
MSSAQMPDGPERSEDTEDDARVSREGAIAWMTTNSVAANLLMVVLIVGGLIMINRVKQEVFPEIERDMVRVEIAYPGASPEEVESGVLLAVEESIRGIDGIEEIRGDAAEGRASVSADLLRGADKDKALNDITAAVGRITSLPQDAERPVVSLASNQQQVLSIIISGDKTPRELERLAEETRRQLLTKKTVSLVKITGMPPPEISIEVSQESLRRYGLTLQQVADAVRASSIELPGGGVRTEGGEVLLRTTERKEFGWEFDDVAVLSRPDGTRVTLADIATIKDTYRETDEAAYLNGERAVQVQVFRVGDQTPIDVSDTVKDYLDNDLQAPQGVSYQVWNDRSDIYRDRINLLLENAGLGLILVLLLLGLFLKPRLAFWVTLGIIISFMGAILLMPALGVSLNMISLFAFLLALGIVVDDAIVVGEAIFNARSEHDNLIDAAIAGTREVAVPVVFAVLTTMVAFTPLLFIPGMMGQFFENIPMIVIPILLFSLVEALGILPAHLAHGKTSEDSFLAKISAPQRAFSNWVEYAIDAYYRPFVEKVVEYRYITIAASLGLLVLTAGVIGGGLVKFNFFPEIEGDQSNVSIEMPFGTSVGETERVMKIATDAARTVMRENGGEEKLGRGVYAQIGRVVEQGGPQGARVSTGSHVSQVTVSLVPPDQRELSAAEFTSLWREEMGTVAGVERLNFEFSIGPGTGAPVSFELRHGDQDILERAAKDAAAALDEYTGVFDINDGFQEGKPQLDFELLPAARALGVTEADLARQVRNAFYGAEARREQRGRNELRIFVRRPRDERETMYSIEKMMIRTPNGGEIPLERAAKITRGTSPTEIERENGSRAVDLSADVDLEQTTPNSVMSSVESELLPMLMDKYPGLSWEKSGQQMQQEDSFEALSTGMMIALMVMFALMAVTFRSYIQPLVIMFAIPFGAVGATIGHLVLGYNLSLISVLGLIALSGVVVNDSLVLIAAANDYRRKGEGAHQAIVDAGARRFRPILLTSLTTFFGLAPMIAETSVQAKFLIPMAISLGFGVLFVTVIALVIVPATYMVVEDVRQLFMSEDEAVPGGGAHLAEAE